MGLRYSGDFMATYTQICWSNNPGNNNVLLGTLTQEIEGDTIDIKDTVAYQTYSPNYAFIQVRYGRGGSSLIDTPIKLTSTIDNTMTFDFTNKVYVSDFSWTNNDAALIKSGQPVTNLTASAFNVFLDKLNLISGLTRTNIYDSYRVSSGDTITAAQFTRLRSALWFGFMYLEGRSSQNLNKLPNVRAGTTISAEILSTGEYSFKNALNKLIHAMRP